MKIVTPIIAGLLLATAPARAQICGPDVKHSTKKVEGKSPLETNPPAGKAVVYVLAPTYEGGYLQMKVSADRVWIGVNQYKSYFVAALDPGEHDFCSKSGDNATHLKLTLEAGKSYYLRQDTVAKMGVGMPPTTLQELTAEDAAVLLKKCKRMEFAEKSK
ncbi:MAG TPA: DUF2846 domain-containing protein [Chthoniobacterales bacterium]|nr:DUF2846 domain-containing protein [Chthoniobacterales bacterium]